jgi:single-strand DNA-binding protein
MIQAFITGRLGKDAELRQAGRDNVCSFSVASGRKVKGEETTTWVRCSLWGKRGEALVQYLTKGTKIAVGGELSTREHNGKTYLDLRVGEMLELMGGGNRNGGSPRGGSSSDSSSGGNTGYDDDYAGPGATDDDDIPFTCVDERAH